MLLRSFKPVFNSTVLSFVYLFDADINASVQLISNIEPPWQQGHQLVLPIAFSTLEFIWLTLINDLEKQDSRFEDTI